jgi:hypothetical protein
LEEGLERLRRCTEETVRDALKALVPSFTEVKADTIPQ